MARYDVDHTLIGELLADPDVIAIVERPAPGLTRHPLLSDARYLTIPQARAYASGVVTPAQLDEIVAAIAALPER